MDPKSSTSKDVADSSDTEPEVFTQPLTPAEEKRREDERKDEAQRRRLDAQLKQLGYKGPGDLKSVIMAIMQDDFPTTPGPAEAALMEKMRAEMGIDVNDEHLSGDETEESELSDYSDSGSELDTLEFLEDLGVGSDVSTPPSAEQAEKALEKRDQRRMARAFLRASKAMRVLARENKAVSEIIARRPGLRSLAEMMAGLGPSPFTALQSPAAPVPVHMPSSARFQLLQQVSQKGIIPAAPKKDKSGQYPCRMPGCDTVSLSWSGADSHMRAVHTQMAYGPCNGCGQCKFNRDSFKRHQKNCMAKRGMEPPITDDLPEMKVENLSSDEDEEEPPNKKAREGDE